MRSRPEMPSFTLESIRLPKDLLVDISDLHFNYDGRPVLQGINMKIRRGIFGLSRKTATEFSFFLAIPTAVIRVLCLGQP